MLSLPHFIVFDNLNTEVWLAAIVLLHIGKCTDKEDLDFLAYLNSFSHNKQHLKWFYLDKREGLFLLMLRKIFSTFPAIEYMQCLSECEDNRILTSD